MSENNQKQPNIDATAQVDYQWEVLKMSNRMVDILKLIEQNTVKIRSNSARLSRTQAELKRLRDGDVDEEGWEPEGRGDYRKMRAPLDLHAMDYKELEEALKRE